MLLLCSVFCWIGSNTHLLLCQCILTVGLFVCEIHNHKSDRYHIKSRITIGICLKNSDIKKVMSEQCFISGGFHLLFLLFN